MIVVITTEKKKIFMTRKKKIFEAWVAATIIIRDIIIFLLKLFWHIILVS